MPLFDPPRAPLSRLLTALTPLTAVPLAACGVPPELRQPGLGSTPTRTAPAAPTPGVSPSPAGSPPLVPPATAGADLVAVNCRNGPSADRVLTLLRGPAQVLPRGVVVRVRTGPLCARDWQYTVLEVTGHEELQVVTRGRPDALLLVTAGTDVCTVEVRAAGPVGIRTLACDGAPAPVPGA